MTIVGTSTYHSHRPLTRHIHALDASIDINRFAIGECDKDKTKERRERVAEYLCDFLWIGRDVGRERERK